MTFPTPVKCRHLILVFGDQLNRDSAAFADADPEQDVVWMAEVDAEACYVWSHKQRIALFLSAMRHFRNDLLAEGWRMDYSALPEESARPAGNDAKEAKVVTANFSAALEGSLERWKPEVLVAVEPGEYRVREGLKRFCEGRKLALDLREDAYFFCSRRQFDQHVKGRKSLRMEFFYREMRKSHQVLLDANNQPTGGSWNFDNENRQSFGRSGPAQRIEPARFAPDALTREVLKLVENRFASHPGSLENFSWPVTREQALETLRDFCVHRLASFGPYQDALWGGEPFLYHSLLASSLNLHLLNPREVVKMAEEGYRSGAASLPSVEGFIRQILGWREYVRGIYWHFMPDYLNKNFLHGQEDLPAFFWTGQTKMNCLREVIGQTMAYGYAHHIQRLMVTGLYSLLLGVRPAEVHRWYLAVYVDAVEWVELPNTLGMAQFADGGIMASKPYVATGKYIQRMSNYCQGCPFDPAEAVGPKACPFTTLYWDFLLRQEDRLAGNHRMVLQLRNLGRLSKERRSAIQERAREIRANPSLG